MILICLKFGITKNELNDLTIGKKNLTQISYVLPWTELKVSVRLSIMAQVWQKIIIRMDFITIEHEHFWLSI
jgi:hypothetical protein